MFLWSEEIHCLKWYSYLHPCVRVVAQTCLTLCDPLNCTLPGSTVQEIIQEIFPTQGYNPGLLNLCLLKLLNKQVYYLPLCHLGGPIFISTDDWSSWCLPCWSNRYGDSACNFNSLLYTPYAMHVFWNRIYQIVFFLFRGIFVFLLYIKDFKALAYVLFFLPFII